MTHDANTPTKGRAAAFAPSRRGHANIPVKVEPRCWSRPELPRRQESQSSRTKDKSKKSGKILAKCVPRRHFARHFAYMESISCQNQLILDAWRRYLATKGPFSCPGPLWECIATRYCHDLPLKNTLRLNLAKEGAFRQRANTQRRFLARLHPMLTRKKGLQDKGCRTKRRTA